MNEFESKLLNKMDALGEVLINLVIEIRQLRRDYEANIEQQSDYTYAGTREYCLEGLMYEPCNEFNVEPAKPNPIVEVF